MATKTMERANKDIELRPKHELTGIESTRPGKVFSPNVDILETDEEITVLADMPGVNADGLNVDLRDNVMTIDGRVEFRERKNERVLLREYATGGFRSEFRLTELIDRERIDASLRDGVLRLTLPKAEVARPRKIEVRAG